MAAVTMSQTTQRKNVKQKTITATAPRERGPLEVWLSRLMIPFTTSLMLWLCYFPVSWGFFAWVALVPLLCLIRQERTKKSLFGLAYLAGLAFFVPVLQWMRVADFRMTFAWLALALYCALYFPITMLFIRFLDRKRIPMWLSVPAAWVGMEWVRAWMISGFAWYYLGHSQHRFLPVIQIADIGGVYLISALIAAINGLLFEMLYRWPGFRFTFRQQEPEVSPEWEFGNWKPVALGILLVVGGLIATLVYGSHRLDEDEFLAGPRVALLQGNIDQRLRNQAADPENADVLLSIAEHYRQLYPLAYDLGRTHKDRMPELVIWPETSYPGFWAEANPNVPVNKMPEGYRLFAEDIPILMQALTDPRGLIPNGRVDRKTGKFIPHDPPVYFTCPTNHLIGMNGALLNDDAEQVHYNLAVLIDKKGNKLGRYEKVHPVPFGEYIPFRKQFPFMSMFSPYGKDWPGIEAGTKLTRMQLHVPAYGTRDPFPFSFGVLICFEDTDPTLARNYAVQHEDGAPVHFLVNISNDGWFDGTAEHEEHLAICRFRAIEARRAVVRSVNMGISAVIDSNGRVQKPLEGKFQTKTERNRPNKGKIWMVAQGEDGTIADLPVSEWSDFKQVDGVIHATVPIDRRESLYAHWGDWVPGLCWGLIGLVMVVAIGKRLTRKEFRPKLDPV